MVLYFRDRSLFYLDWYELSQEEIQEERENVDYHNKLLQLDYSLENLLRLREYKERHNEVYQESLNDKELQNDLRKWRDLKNTPEETNRREFEEIKKMVLYFRDRSLFYLDWYELSQEEIQEERENVDYNDEFLQLDYSLANLMKLREYRATNEEIYQADLNDWELQNDLREWRDLNEREFEEIKEMILFFRDFQEFSIQNDYSLSQKEIQDYSEGIVRHNNMLQLRNSPENFYEFRRFKEVNEKDYENLLNNKKLQKKLQEWRRSKRR
ncbi:hypothetical protein N407_05620 [Helicobacter pylori FD662]|nr:hypothetical protein N407_05620 [Helicobacter pylori FD662]